MKFILACLLAAAAFHFLPRLFPAGTGLTDTPDKHPGSKTFSLSVTFRAGEPVPEAVPVALTAEPPLPDPVPAAPAAHAPGSRELAEEVTNLLEPVHRWAGDHLSRLASRWRQLPLPADQPLTREDQARR